MSDEIDQENPAAYYGEVADELERIARAVSEHPSFDRAFSARLFAFAEQIRRDSAIVCAPEGSTIN
ncbi:MAG TPA: hypothetical protein VLW75_11365 [Rhizomicrobium sp.]|nr:hypothetical protein [Rhizomicrobium sp.]